MRPLLAFLAVASTVALHAQGTVVDYTGSLNPSAGKPLGITLSIQLGPDSAVPQHIDAIYAYATTRKDIPLHGELNSQNQLVLREDDATGKLRATFVLDFIGNGSEGKASFNFRNSIGFRGRWNSATDANSYPVSLNMTSSSENTTLKAKSSPAAIRMETRATTFLQAVAVNNRSAAADNVHFPLRANLLPGKRILTRTRFLSAWDTIFTPSYKACLAAINPHQTFSNSHGTMLGNGEVWLDDRGVITLNECIKQ